LVEQFKYIQTIVTKNNRFSTVDSLFRQLYLINCCSCVSCNCCGRDLGFAAVVVNSFSSINSCSGTSCGSVVVVEVDVTLAEVVLEVVVVVEVVAALTVVEDVVAEVVKVGKRKKKNEFPRE